DLAQQFHTRIEMRQIGVRDESKMLGGVGPCGRELCCSCYLKAFAPVSIRMAKDQNLALNPQKVSGLCGRLMCCLAYEQSTYEEIWGQIPKIGKRVNTPKGEGKVMSVDIKNQKVRTLIGDEMEIFTVEESRELNKDLVRGQRGHRGPQHDRGPQPPPPPAEQGEGQAAPQPEGPTPGPRQDRPERQGQRGQSRPPQRGSQRSEGGSRRDGQRSQPRPPQQQQAGQPQEQQGQSQQPAQAQGAQLQPRPSQQMQGPMPRARQTQRGVSQAMQGGRPDNRGPRPQQAAAVQPLAGPPAPQAAAPVEAPARPSDEVIKSALAPMLSPDPATEKKPGEGESK
ncbi:MAG: regulatory iron-sulfur-containing complex subunit RicT, partial [Myxococcota bacterium]